MKYKAHLFIELTNHNVLIDVYVNIYVYIYLHTTTYI